jgi:hypothetical protein
MRKADKLANAMNKSRKGRVAPEDRQANDGDDEVGRVVIEGIRACQLRWRFC